MARTFFYLALAGLCLTLVGCGGATTGGAPGGQASNNPKAKGDDLPPANPIPQAKETLPPPVFKTPDNRPVVDDPPAQKNKTVQGAAKSKTVTGTIKSVNGGNITVSVGGQDQSFAIRADAFISQQRNRQPVTLDAVHAGAVAEVCVDLASNQVTSVHLMGN